MPNFGIPVHISQLDMDRFALTMEDKSAIVFVEYGSIISGKQSVVIYEDRLQSWEGETKAISSSDKERVLSMMETFFVANKLHPVRERQGEL